MHVDSTHSSIPVIHFVLVPRRPPQNKMLPIISSTYLVVGPVIAIRHTSRHLLKNYGAPNVLQLLIKALSPNLLLRHAHANHLPMYSIALTGTNLIRLGPSYICTICIYLFVFIFVFISNLLIMSPLTFPTH